MTIVGTSIGQTKFLDLTVNALNPCTQSNNFLLDFWFDYSVQLYRGATRKIWTDANFETEFEISLCGTFNYDFLDVETGEAPDPAIFSFSSDDRYWDAEANDRDLLGSYTIEMRGWQGLNEENSASFQFVVTIEDPCEAMSLQIPTIHPS